MHEDLIETARNMAAETVSAATIHMEPVPYIVVDGLIDAALMAAMHDHWPAADLFDPEYTGKHVMTLWAQKFDIMAPELSAFWRQVGLNWYPAVLNAALNVFAPHLRAVFGDLMDSPEWGGLPMLMQNDGQFTSQNTHTHFYHNPNWTMTSLMYLGGPDDGSPGTTLWAPKGDKADVEWLADIAMDTLRWDRRHDIEPHSTIDYKENRLFCFLDGPLALHGVLSGGAQFDGCRRVLRSHMGVSTPAFLGDRVPFLEDQNALTRMFMPPVNRSPNIMRDISVADFERREGPGRQFVIDEIQARDAPPFGPGVVVAPVPPFG